MVCEVVLTCVNYSDFLIYTLPWAARQFDYIVVVTSPDDIGTQQVCDAHRVHCVQTNAFFEGGSFCKGKGINAGLAALSKRDWVLHLDADIALPQHTRHALEFAQLDPTCLYGVDRVNCRSYEEWARFLASPFPQHEKDVFVHVGPFPPGVRMVQSSMGGYCPLGFAQLWNPKGSGINSYPEDHTDAGRGDVLFSLQWPRQKRILLPEVVGYHLESAKCAAGTNWQGRKTPRFGPEPIPIALRFGQETADQSLTDGPVPEIPAERIEEMVPSTGGYVPDTTVPSSPVDWVILGLLLMLATPLLAVPGIGLATHTGSLAVSILSALGLVTKAIKQPAADASTHG